MPYDPSNPPSKVRGLPSNKQRQWTHVFNSCYDKYGDDTKCHKMAWGVTGGWKTEKGFSDSDPDRDILIELEVDKIMQAEDALAKELGAEVVIKVIKKKQEPLDSNPE